MNINEQVKAELADVLRNPNGAYFCDESPAMVALEIMVDTVGIANVLYALARVSGMKAEHLEVEANRQDSQSAQWWAERVEALAKGGARVFRHV